MSYFFAFFLLYILSVNATANVSQEAIWRFYDQGDEVAASKMEKSLSEVLKHKAVKEKIENPHDNGLHPSYLVTLVNGVKGIFKPYSYWRVSMNYKSEIAAYQLDQLLKLHRVPMTVEREIDGKKGSFQYYIKDAQASWSSNRPLPQDIRVFDYLMENWDRHAENFIYKEDKAIAIDHGWAFRRLDFFHKPLSYWLWSGCGKNKQLLDQNKSELYDRLNHLKDEDFKQALSPWLSGAVIKQVIARKNALITPNEAPSVSDTRGYYLFNKVIGLLVATIWPRHYQARQAG